MRRNVSLIGSIAVLCMLSLTLIAQKTNINKLLQEYEKTHQKHKPKVLNDIAWYYKNISPGESMDYAKRSLKLSSELLKSYLNKEGIESKRKVGLYVLSKEKAKALYLLGLLNLKKENFDQALNYQYKSLAIMNTMLEGFPYDVETKEYTANLFNDIGYIYKTIGRYDEAIKNYQKAIEVNKELGALKETGINYNNLGVVYEKTEHYQESVNSFSSALDVANKLNEKEKIAMQNNNIGQIFLTIREYDKANEYFDKALETCKKNNLEDTQKAKIIINMGMAALSEGKYEKAIEIFNKAKNIYEKSENKARVANQLNNIGMVHKASGNYDEILKYFNEALNINKTIGAGDSYAKNYNQLGDIYLAKEDLDKAIEYYNNSIMVYDQVKGKATSFKKYFITKDQEMVYKKLINAYIQRKNLSKAIFTLQMAKAKKNAGYLGLDFQNLFIPTIEQIQTSLGKGEVIVDYELLDNDHVTVLAITKDEMFINKIKKEELEKRFNEVFLMSGGSAKAFFNRGKSGFSKYEDKDVFSSIIHYYRQLVMEKEPDADAQTKRIYLGKILYKFLVSTVEHKINKAKKIFFVRDGVLGSIPFETLITPDEKYFLIKKDIGYLPSLACIKLINQRNYNGLRRNLLLMSANNTVEKALSETDKNIIPKIYKSGMFTDMQVSIAGQSLLNNDQVFYLRKKIDNSITNDSSLVKVYKWLGYKIEEAETSKEKIMEKFEDQLRRSDIELNLTEEMLEELSKNEELKKYKYLHFGVPGIGFPEIPLLNALVLEKTQKDDGLFNIYEIPSLKINTETVSITGFHTDTRKNYVGDGSVLTALAFMHSGANGVHISCWETGNDTREFFMKELYKILSNNEELSFYEAMNQLKRKMIRWEYDEKLSNPYYWAQFTYFGK